MSITLEQLSAITNSDEARLLPTRISNTEGLRFWWDHVDEMTRRATECDMMTVALHARLAFEVYPFLESIDPRWSAEGRGEDVYTDSVLRINGDYYHPDSPDIDTALMEKMEEVDDAEALAALHNAVEDAMGSRQLKCLDRPNELFGDKLTCAEDANALIAKIDPDIRAFYEQKILDIETPRSTGPKGLGRL